ncbi:MAG: adaptor protein MecA [Lachnospiraceae bacterium]|nr:adaptor protein MecA [Lachnospiraceae bacterium]
MKITRIDHQTVNCIITQEDLDEQGVILNDLLTKKENAIGFLKEILTRVSEEVGYHPQGNMTTMQAFMLSDGSISLTISENPAGNLREALEMITSRLGVKIPERILKEIGDAPEEERLERLKEFVENFKDFTEMFKQMIDNQSQHASQELPAIGKGERRKRALLDDDKRLLFHEYVFAFDSMQEVIRYAGKIPESVKVQSALYSDDKGHYRLILTLGEEEEMVFASMFTIGYEYGHYITTNHRQIMHMKEHMSCVIAEDAIRKLSAVYAG